MTLLDPSVPVVLGSRSPRRRELVELLLPGAALEILPPRSPDEAGFDDCSDEPALFARLAEIAESKADDVLDQWTARTGSHGRPLLLICADTAILAQDDRGALRALGQPPDDDSWRDVVRDWFERYYFDRDHLVATAVCLVRRDSGKDPFRRTRRTVTTRVRFSSRHRDWLEWYLDSGEPRGKAGGYGLQGLASLFAERIEGSITNIVGLPLEALREMLAEGVEGRGSRV